MSASDAKESIQSGGFGSVKERMAALKGKGAFGAPGLGGGAPPPPTSKPPPPKKVVSPAAVDEDDPMSPPTQTEAPNADAANADTPEAQTLPAEAPTESTEEVKAESPEDEEQARRAAIAARMARLGGTRIGMAPPVFGKKPPPPPVKRPSMDVQGGKFSFP